VTRGEKNISSDKMPRREDDTATDISIDFPKDPTNEDGRSSAQVDQLSRAREKALKNRRLKLKLKMEHRLSELRQQLGDVNNETLEKAVKLLLQTEEHHRTKLNELPEITNEKLQSINNEIRAIRKSHSEVKHRSSGSVVTDLSSLRR
jgi:hypothetical protein